MLALVKHLPVRNRTGLDRCTFPRQVASDGGEPRSSIDPPSDAVPSWRPPLHGGVDFGSGLWTRESKAVISYPPSKESLWDNEGWGITNGRRFLPSRCQLALLSLEAASAGVWPFSHVYHYRCEDKACAAFPGSPSQARCQLGKGRKEGMSSKRAFTEEGCLDARRARESLVTIVQSHMEPIDLAQRIKPSQALSQKSTTSQEVGRAQHRPSGLPSLPRYTLRPSPTT